MWDAITHKSLSKDKTASGVVTRKSNGPTLNEEGSYI